MASLQDLPGVADQLLAIFGAQLVELGVQLPARQYRNPSSLVAWDGEQFTVSLMGIAQGQPGRMIGQTIRPPQALHFYASFALTIVRLVSVINTDGFADVEIPTASEIDADGVTTLSDAQALILAASRVYGQHSITSPDEGYEIAGVTPVGPEGGMAGNRLIVNLTVN